MDSNRAASMDIGLIAWYVRFHLYPLGSHLRDFDREMVVILEMEKNKRQEQGVLTTSYATGATRSQ